MAGQSSSISLSASNAFALEVGQLLRDCHCSDVLILQVSGLSQVCDYVVIGTGTSDRQMKSVADEITTFGKEKSFSPFGTSLDTAATWIVVDFISVVIHLFEPQQRTYYDLEDLWAEAKQVELPALPSS